MTARFDALLFDAGGIFVVPDPVTTGMVLEPHGGTTSVARLVRAHYAGMAAIDASTREHDAASIERISWRPYRLAYARDPQAEELKFAKEYLAKKATSVKEGKDAKDTEAARAKARREAYEDTLWALLNTKEFLFNH